MITNREILKTLMSGRGHYGDIFSEKRMYTHIHLESEKIEKIERGLDEGVGLRLITPWKMYFASTNNKDRENLLAMAAALAKFSREKSNRLTEAESHAEGAYSFTITKDPETVPLEKKIGLVKRVESMAKGLESRLRQVRVIYRDTNQEVSILTSEGRDVTDRRTQVVLNLFLVGESNGEMQTAYEAVGGFYGYDFFCDEAVDAFVSKTVRRLSGLLKAREAPMGTKTVVLSSEAGGTMIHEAIGHGLEADLAMEGLSCYKGMLNQVIASPLINVVDDATVPHMRGTYAYDDEGTASELTVLVKNGTLESFLFDKFYAMKYGVHSTGNGRRESYRHKPIPRMSNTMILPGTDAPEKIISSVDDGIYVVKMGGGQVDTVRGDFVFEISEGYIIEKGCVGEMIKNATMMGNGLKVLREIDMVGNDLGFGIGTCGKDGQGVPVSDAQPTLRIPEIVVGGRADG